VVPVKGIGIIYFRHLVVAGEKRVQDAGTQGTTKWDFGEKSVEEPSIEKGAVIP